MGSAPNETRWQQLGHPFHLRFSQPGWIGMRGGGEDQGASMSSSVPYYACQMHIDPGGGDRGRAAIIQTQTQYSDKLMSPLRLTTLTFCLFPFAVSETIEDPKYGGNAYQDQEDYHYRPSRRHPTIVPLVLCTKGKLLSFVVTTIPKQSHKSHTDKTQAGWLSNPVSCTN